MVVRTVTVLVILLLLVVGGGYAAGFFSKYASVKATDGEIVIPLQEVNDGAPHYFVYKEGAREVRFFVLKSEDGVIRAAFDACDVCSPSKGYVQQGQFMLCANCGRKFHSNRINVEQGGCNPAPLTRAERGDMLVIKTVDVLRGAHYFQG